MEITIPVSQGLALKLADQSKERRDYPTSRLQKGLVMIYNGQELAEEAVGFGFPVLKQGLQTLFPGDVALDLLHKDSTWVARAVYTINLVEKIALPGKTSVNNPLIYAGKNSMAAIIRQVPPARGFLTALSSRLRRLYRWETTYEQAGFSTQVKMTYTLDQQTGVLTNEADLACVSRGSITEFIIMNEQGAHYFDQYRDSSGTCLSGNEIGCWDEVTAEEASFACSTHPVAFTLHQVPGARLFRGRELIGSRLAWSGFGYSFAPTAPRFSYTLWIRKLP